LGFPGELALRIVQARFCLVDCGCQCCDLLGAHSGVDIVPLGGCCVERRARLHDRRTQLDRREVGRHVAGPDTVALLDVDSDELPADLGRNANLGRSHDTDEGRVVFAAPKRVSACTKRDENEAKHD